MNQSQTGFFLQDLIDVGLFLYQAPQALGAVGTQAKLVYVTVANGRAYSPSSLGSTWRAGTSQSVSHSLSYNSEGTVSQNAVRTVHDSIVYVLVLLPRIVILHTEVRYNVRMNDALEPATGPWSTTGFSHVQCQVNMRFVCRGRSFTADNDQRQKTIVVVELKLLALVVQVRQGLRFTWQHECGIDTTRLATTERIHKATRCREL